MLFSFSDSYISKSIYTCAPKKLGTYLPHASDIFKESGKLN